LRDLSLKIIREVGVETGGSNILLAINPSNGEVIVIFSPINLFIKVDLPTFGLPSKVTNPDL